MSEKKYKRIGWVVETRKTVDQKWYVACRILSGTKHGAIQSFNSDISFLMGLKFSREYSYGGLHCENLARCVPVYVEVSDAKA